MNPKVGDKVWYFTGTYKIKIAKSIVVRVTPKGCWVANKFPRDPSTKLNHKTSTWRSSGKVTSSERELVEMVLSLAYSSAPFRMAKIRLQSPRY